MIVIAREANQSSERLDRVVAPLLAMTA